MTQQESLTTFNPEAHARCRAYILQAVNAIIKYRMEQPELARLNGWNDDILGPTYVAIREWIMMNKRFHMENVGARVRELARSLKIPYVQIEYDGRHRAHVYPIKEEAKV